MDVPIDWYKPDVWNSWSLRERANFVSAQPNNTPTVALPPANICATFKSISDYARACRDPQFMEKYGNKVLDEYDIPTEEEIKQVEDMEDEFFDEDLDADGNL